MLHRLTALLVVALLLGDASTALAVVGAPSGVLDDTSADVSGLILGHEATDADRSEVGDLRYPDAPADSGRPRFVRQTGKNCAFASAVMLIDKWTDGQLQPAQARLRTASRVPATMGVSFAELSRAVGRVTGLDLRYSPGGGDPLTWPELLSRLARGGGAVIGGSYSRLPRHYQRWAPSFAALGASGSGHAVYVERHEPGAHGGRVWMMDPLGRSSGYSGEWISVGALRQFAWRNSAGLVSAAATPEPPPLAGYEFGTPEVGEAALAGREVAVRIPLVINRGWTRPKGLTLTAVWKLVEPEPDPASLITLSPTLADGAENAAPGSVDDAPTGADPLAQDLGADDILQRVAEPTGTKADASDTTDARPRRPQREAGRERETGPEKIRLRAEGDYLVGTLRAPDEPGIHVLQGEVHAGRGAATDSRQLDAASVRLLGPLAAAQQLVSVSESPLQGENARIDLSISNHGSRDWAGETSAHVVASWETPVGVLDGGSTVIELEAGESATFQLGVEVPTLVSEGTLRLELVTTEGVPLSAYGAEPVLFWLRFATARPADDGKPISLHVHAIPPG